MKKMRLNIYVDDPAVRKQVKTAAARHDVSVSEYCLRALKEKLAIDDEGMPKESSLSKAVERARRFQRRAFAGRTFSVNSATLIAQARRERAGK